MKTSLHIFLFSFPILYFATGLVMAVCIDRGGSGEFDADRDARGAIYMVLIALGPVMLLAGAVGFFWEELRIRLGGKLNCPENSK